MSDALFGEASKGVDVLGESCLSDTQNLSATR